jgi:ubiquinol-cytochrome c reductase cytochrome c subunit
VTSLSARRRHPLAAALLLLVALVLVGGLYAVLSPTEQAQASAPLAASQQVEEGRTLYLENCSSCHGLNGQGTTDGPSLIGVGAASVDFQVGTGRMPAATSQSAQVPQARVQFSDEEIEALAAYVATLGPGPAIPTEEELDYSEADIAEGGELFRTNCAQCHNFSGQGGALTNGKYAPSLMGVSPEHIYEAMLTGPQAMPKFSDEALTPEDKQAIIGYLKSLENEPNPGGFGLGRLGPVSEGLVGWVVGMGMLIAAAIWIGAKST